MSGNGVVAAFIAWEAWVIRRPTSGFDWRRKIAASSVYTASSCEVSASAGALRGSDLAGRHRLDEVV